MRLIDADKIEFVLPRTLTEEEKNTYSLVIKKAFENAPTVDAIPIRWLKRWGATNFAEYGKMNEILFEISYKPIILEAIDDWEHKRGEWE